MMEEFMEMNSRYYYLRKLVSGVLLLSNNLFFCVCETYYWLSGAGVGPRIVAVQDQQVHNLNYFEFYIFIPWQMENQAIWARVLLLPLFSSPCQNQIKYFGWIFWSDEKQILFLLCCEVFFSLLLVFNYNSAIFIVVYLSRYFLTFGVDKFSAPSYSPVI